MAQPAFSRCNQTCDHLRPMRAGKFASGVSRPLIPRERWRAGGELTFLGEIYKGRKQPPLFDRAGRRQLRNGNDVSGSLLQIPPRDSAICSAEIDADNMPSHDCQGNSTSAGVMTRGSRVSEMDGM